MNTEGDLNIPNHTLAHVREIVDDMHVAAMAMSLVHLTGDESVLDEVEDHIHGPWDYQESVPPEVKEKLRVRMMNALHRYLEEGTPLAEITPQLMQRMLKAAVGEAVPSEYEPLIRAQMGADLATKANSAPDAAEAVPRERMHVVIVGAGVSGLCAAIKLKELGISFEILEKNPDIGGTWLENRYPGCAVDTPNHFYQFSFEPNDDWPRYYSRAEDNLNYLQHCTDKYGIRPHIRFNCEVLSSDYREDTATWDVTYRETSGDTTISANVLVTAVGQLNRPATPHFAGLSEFEGIVTHTAEWPEDLDVRGKNVALIGAAASAVQVGCAIAPEAKSLTIFQRSGSWIVRSPNVHRPVTENMKWALKNVPFYAAWYRFQLFWAFADGLYPALRMDPEWKGDPRSTSEMNDRLRRAVERYIRSELAGREDLLEKVIPDYPIYGKRALADPGWFKMLRRDNVALTTSTVTAVEPYGVRTADGTLTSADIIVMATGFQAGRMLWPMDIRGLGGKTVRELWGRDDPRAYLGMTIPDFPNMFVLYGPNVATAHGGSYTFLAECQVRYLVASIEEMLEHGLRSFAVRREVFEQYNKAIDAELKNFVWSHPNVRSWYSNDHGRVIVNSPWRLVDFWRMTQRPDMNEYVTEPVNLAVDATKAANGTPETC